MRFRILGLLGAVAMLSACNGAPNGSQSDASGGESSDGGSNLKAVLLEGKPFAVNKGDGFEGWSVDVINAVKDEAGLGSVDFSVASSVNEGFEAITSGAADIACGVAFSWERAEKVNYSLPTPSVAPACWPGPMWMAHLNSCKARASAS